MREVQKKHYVQFFTVSVKMEDKRKLNPYALRPAIRAETGATPESITTDSQNAYTIKIRNENQSEKLMNLEKGDIKCKDVKHSFYNQSKMEGDKVDLQWITL